MRQCNRMQPVRRVPFQNKCTQSVLSSYFALHEAGSFRNFATMVCRRMDDFPLEFVWQKTLNRKRSTRFMMPPEFSPIPSVTYIIARLRQRRCCSQAWHAYACIRWYKYRTTLDVDEDTSKKKAFLFYLSTIYLTTESRIWRLHVPPETPKFQYRYIFHEDPFFIRARESKMVYHSSLFAVETVSGKSLDSNEFPASRDSSFCTLNIY